MKKSIIFLFIVGISSISNAQIKTNEDINQNTLVNSTAFFDASSSTLWNNSEDMGKGLVFPRVDLTQLEELKQQGPNVGTNFPTRMDGMVVYNVGEGAPKIGVADTPNVTRGFYYYENKTDDLQGGHWVRIGSGDTAASSENRKIVDVTFSGTYAKIPDNTFASGDEIVNAYLLKQDTGEKVGSVKIERNTQRPGLTGDYVFSSNGPLYTTLNGNYKLVVDIKK